MTININIPSDVSAVLNLLTENGYKAYIVGGCLRDSLMGTEPHDWDVATSAEPNETKEVFSAFKTVDTGVKHGTVLVISGETPVEITTFRIDGEYSDNRRPDSVAFSKSVEEDLARRDFTVNAMAYHPDEGLIDIFGGREDIEKKIIRCVGNADDRFNEDALRILRALRFASVLSFDIEEKTARAIIKNEQLLTKIAVERIDAEMVKLLCGDNVFDILMKYRSVFGVFMPELKLEFDFKQYGAKHAYDVWEHTAHTVASIENDSILRLTMLLHDTGKPATHEISENGASEFKNHAAVGGVIAENILSRMKFSKEYISTVSYLVSIHDKKVPETRTAVKEYIRDLGEENFIRLMKIRRADRSALSEGYRDISDKLIFAYEQFDEIITSDEPCALRQLAVKGGDVKKFVSGGEIGDALNFLLDEVIKDASKNTKSVLLKILKEKYPTKQ